MEDYKEIHNIVALTQAGTLIAFKKDTELFPVIPSKHMIKIPITFGRCNVIAKKGDYALLAHVRILSSVFYQLQLAQFEYGPREPTFSLKFLIKNTLFVRTMRLRRLYEFIEFIESI